MEEKPLCPFGDVLAKARKERGITQYRLAKLAKRSARHISMLEHNKREPQLSTVIMIARALRMDAGELVSEVDALMPKEWAVPDEAGMEPRKAGRPKKKQRKVKKFSLGIFPGRNFAWLTFACSRRGGLGENSAG